jgi:hypothetical protein
MTDVACFCDYLYSFEGAAGACPRCGAVAAIVTGATPTGYERSRRAQQPMPASGGNAEGAVPENEGLELAAWRLLLSGT